VLTGKQRHEFGAGLDFAGNDVAPFQGFDLIAEKGDADEIVPLGFVHIHHVAADTEFSFFGGHVVASVLDVHQTAQDFVAAEGVADFDADAEIGVVVR